MIGGWLHSLLITFRKVVSRNEILKSLFQDGVVNGKIGLRIIVAPGASYEACTNLTASNLTFTGKSINSLLCGHITVNFLDAYGNGAGRRLEHNLGRGESMPVLVHGR